jgi:hypothetical protein
MLAHISVSRITDLVLVGGALLIVMLVFLGRRRSERIDRENQKWAQRAALLAERNAMNDKVKSQERTSGESHLTDALRYLCNINKKGQVSTPPKSRVFKIDRENQKWAKATALLAERNALKDKIKRQERTSVDQQVTD